MSVTIKGLRTLSLAAAAAAGAGVVGLGSSSADAAAFMTVDLLGRVQGSGLPFSSSVEVEAGNVVEYQVRIQLAPEGTTNVNPTGTGFDTIVNWVPSQGSTNPTSGLNALLFSLTQAEASGIQADFDGAIVGATTGGGTWGAGTGSSVGTVTARGATGNDDLLNVRLFRESGNFDGIGAGDVPESLIIASGVFDIASAGAASVVNMTLTGIPTTQTIATYRWRNAANTADVNYLETSSQQTNSVTAGDPIIDFNDLSLTPIPEPATLGLAAVAGLGLLARRRRKA